MIGTQAGLSPGCAVFALTRRKDLFAGEKCGVVRNEVV